ncbi:hypothetical protein POM88_007499 [Heracleum sosnowskyi]|uniref:RNase H type-1 domain-containing protein n=1 Tax=Heracleum sosnowskyi TaxID=360622 RepID=A0AAD8N6I4_9APIA|nr:hypothetical protein POM88_007499 [Heracleum sosnowskyi]
MSKNEARGFLLYMGGDYGEYTLRVFPGSRIQPSHSYSSWQPPPQNVIKFNTDAAMLGGGLIGFGVVGRDSTGQVVLVAVLRYKTNWESKMAEMAAARFGLIVHAERFGYRHIHLESDALEVVNYFNDVGGFVSDLHLRY